MGWLTGFKVREVPGESGPPINFEEKLGDLHVRQETIARSDESVSLIRNHIRQRADPQMPGRGHCGIGQLTDRRELFDDGELLLQPCGAFGEELFHVGDDRKTERVIGTALYEDGGRHEILVEVLVLPRTGNPNIP